MSRPFRLAAVERLRGRELQTAAGELAAAQRAASAARAERDRLTAELLACSAPAGPGTAGGSGRPGSTGGSGAAAGAWGLATAGARREWLRDQLAISEQQVAQAEAEVATRLAVWQAARARLRAVEELHARHRAELASQAARAEQRLADELALVRAARAARAARRPTPWGGGEPA